MIQVFINQMKLPIDIPAPNGNGFRVGTYENVEELNPVASEPEFEIPRKPQIRSAKGELEGPVWTASSELIGDDLVSEFAKEEVCFSVFNDRYFGYSSTKVGGWPTYISPGDIPGE